jgi:acyl dehydratase
MAINIHFDDVKVGDQIPAWSRKTDFMNWNRYAAVNDEFIYIHMDDEAGRAAANEKGAFGMGNLRFAYILNSLREWAGDEAEIRELECQFRAINQKNDVLTVTATVTGKRVEDGENRIYLDVDVVNQEGAKTCPGHAIVVLPNR